MKYILSALLGAILANLLWAGLWYNNILPNRMTHIQYIYGEKTHPLPSISFGGYSPESDFDAVLADEVWKLKFGDK
jgi:hypothetical protein